MLDADSDRVSLAEWPRADEPDTSEDADAAEGSDDYLVDMSSISIASFIADRIERDPSAASFRPIVMTYQIAHLCSQPPAKAVEAQYGLAPRTAARWIARAKELGLLKTPAVEQLRELDG